MIIYLLRKSTLYTDPFSPLRTSALKMLEDASLNPSSLHIQGEKQWQAMTRRREATKCRLTKLFADCGLSITCLVNSSRSRQVMAEWLRQQTSDSS